MSKIIVIESTMKIVQRVPFNEEYYPNCKTPEEAVEHENALSIDEKIELFEEAIPVADVNSMNFSQIVTIEDDED